MEAWECASESWSSVYQQVSAATSSSLEAQQAGQAALSFRAENLYSFGSLDSVAVMQGGLLGEVPSEFCWRGAISWRGPSEFHELRMEAWRCRTCRRREFAFRQALEVQYS